MTKGKSSYWYAYLRMLPDVDFSCRWTTIELAGFQDQTLSRSMNEYRDIIDQDWLKFEKVLKEHPHIFPARFHESELFFNIFAQVATRIFSGLESYCMVPMADNMNHSNVTVVHETIDLALHSDPLKNINYYRTDKFMNDYLNTPKGKMDH